MRPGQQNNKRMRGRNRKGPNPLSRNYESNGPDVKVRGSAQHVAEKYVQLARDASVSGDRILAESYLQHAEHYYRIVAAAQAQMPQSQPIVRADDPQDDYDDLDELGNESGVRQDTGDGESDDEAGSADAGSESEERHNRQEHGERADRRERGERQDRGERRPRRTRRPVTGEDEGEPQAAEAGEGFPRQDDARQEGAPDNTADDSTVRDDRASDGEDEEGRQRRRRPRRRFPRQVDDPGSAPQPVAAEPAE